MAACKLWAHAVYGSKHPLFDSPPQAGCLLWVRYPLSKLSHWIVKWGWPCLSSCTVTGRILNTKLFRGYQATIEPPPKPDTLLTGLGSLPTALFAYEAVQNMSSCNPSWWMSTPLYNAVSPLSNSMHPVVSTISASALRGRENVKRVCPALLFPR